MGHAKDDLADLVLGDRYRVVRQLGVSALGSVYEVTSGPFDKKWAIKVLDPHLAHDEAVVQRFKREARAAASLKHPHIVEVADFVTEAGKPPFLVMELLTGQSLRDVLKRQKRITPERAARIAVQVLSALGAAHDAGIVHRDIKPENVFLAATATAVDVVKVLDFGSAKLLGECDGKPLTVTGMAIGTLAFMPPEQALGRRVDGRADLYALAATIYGAVTGKKLFEAKDPASLLTAVVRRDPAPLARAGVDVDRAFEAILVKALKKDPAERFRSAAAMSRAFEGWLETAPPPLASDPSMITPGGVAIDAEEESHHRVRLPRAGHTLGRYRLVERLGAGGLGEVFRASDTSLDRDVAIKVLRIAHDPDETGISVRTAAHMLVEARAAAMVHHPNVVEVFDVNYTNDGIAYLVMELVPGKPLRHFIGDPYVPIERKIGWLIDVARALSAAHKKGVVHQDIKPENVMVRDDGVIKVVDFGIARRVFDNDSSLPGSESLERIPGTPVYMAPEQMRGAKGNALTDQFTWAVFAYELLAGTIPWLQHGGVLHVVNEILERTPDAPSHRRGDVPKEIDAVVLKALSKRPGNRYASMDDVIAALASAWARAASEPIDEIVVRKPRRRGLVTAIAVAASLLVGAAAPQDARVAPVAASTTTAIGAPDFGSTMSSNPAATAAYVAGVNAVHDAAGGTARKNFDLAIKLDPTFAAAHLRRVLLASDVTEAEREDISVATRLRDSLGEHDRALLRAIEPWVAIPQDAREVERRLTLLTALRPDSDYFYQLCHFRMLEGKYSGALESCRAARQIDGRFAGAYWFEGQSHLFLNDNVEGDTALRNCLSISPGATQCVNDLYYMQSHAGACDAALGYAEALIKLEPDNGRWLEQLGMASYAMDKPLDDARSALEKALYSTPARRLPAKRAQTQFKLAALTGDFTSAQNQLDVWERAVDGSSDELEHYEAFRFHVLFLRENGRSAAAAVLARSYLAARVTWLPSADLDTTIDGLIAEYRGGALLKPDFLKARTAWIAQERAQQRIAGRFGMGPGRLWITAYADSVDNAEDARDALAMLPDYLPLPPDRVRDSEDDEAIGRTFLLAGKVDEAIPFLRRAANSCEAVRYPLQQTWANLELGEALESSDRRGACAAYQVVLERWITVPTSVGARRAEARRNAIHCQ